MQNFLVVYDTSSNQAKISSFGDLTAANTARSEAESENDSNLEIVMGGKHQTISALRRSLVIDGWIVDSGRTRINNQGNDCIVWVEKDEAFSGVLFDVK